MISPPDTTKRGRGRPKLYEQKRSRILKSSVTEAERLTVIERAARHGMGVSDYIRHRALGLRIVKSSA